MLEIWVEVLVSAVLTGVVEIGYISRLLVGKTSFFGSNKVVGILNFVLLMVSTGLYSIAITKNTVGLKPLVHPVLIVVIWTFINYVTLFFVPQLWGESLIRSKHDLVMLVLFAVGGMVMLYSANRLLLQS